MQIGNQKKVQDLAEEIGIELPLRNADIPNENESSGSFDSSKNDKQKVVQPLAREIDVLVESLTDWQSQLKHQQVTF